MKFNDLDEKYREVVELIIRQNGSCVTPINVSCTKCPLKNKRITLKAIPAAVLSVCKEYLRQLDELKNNEKQHVSMILDGDQNITSLFVGDREFIEKEDIHETLGRIESKIDTVIDNTCEYITRKLKDGFFQHKCTGCGQIRYDKGLPDSYNYCPQCGRKIVSNTE